MEKPSLHTLKTSSGPVYDTMLNLRKESQFMIFLTAIDVSSVPFSTSNT